MFWDTVIYIPASFSSWNMMCATSGVHRFGPMKSRTGKDFPSLPYYQRHRSGPSCSGDSPQALPASACGSCTSGSTSTPSPCCKLRPNWKWPLTKTSPGVLPVNFYSERRPRSFCVRRLYHGKITNYTRKRTIPSWRWKCLVCCVAAACYRLPFRTYHTSDRSSTSTSWSRSFKADIFLICRI